MKKFLFVLFLTLAAEGYSQYNAIYSQYLYNHLVINPAYAGSRNAISSVLMHRARWVGMDGAPTTQTLSIHSKLKNKKFALGFNLNNDRLGATSNLLMGLSGAYHVKFSKSQLSFGLRLGAFNSAIDGTAFNFRNPTDQLNNGVRQSALVPNADFGLYYYAYNYFISLTFNHLLNQRFNYDQLGGVEIDLDNYTTLGAGYVFELSPKFTLKPSFLWKKTVDYDANLDISLNAFFYKRFWVGVSLRNQSSLNVLFDFNVTDFLRVGYSFDMFSNNLGRQSVGVHEFFLGFDFNLKQTKSVSPRYL
jgi:type IX secretion system PorP/SprF family membrane protein